MKKRESKIVVHSMIFVLCAVLLTPFFGIISQGALEGAWDVRNNREPRTMDDGSRSTNDFSNLETGFDINTTPVDSNPFRSMWSPDDAGTVKSVVETANGNNYVHMQGTIEAIYDNTIVDEYMFAASLKYNNFNGAGGIFFRGASERIKAASGQKLWYYQDDETGTNNVGGTGIWLTASEAKKLKITIKGTNAEGSAVVNTAYEIPVDADFSADFVVVKIMDDGVNVNIYLNDTCVARVLCSDSGKYGSSDQLYYKTVAVKNAAGEILGTVQNARVSALSELAFFSAGADYCVDDLTVDYYADNEDPYKDPTAPTPTPTPEKTPDASPSESASATPKAAGTEQEKKDNTTLFIIIGVIAAVLVIGAVIIILLVKGKKKG